MLGPNCNSLSRAFSSIVAMGILGLASGIDAAVPTSSAGPDQTVSKNRLLGADVSLDGAQSLPGSNGVRNFEWLGPFGLSSGASPSVYVPEGAYTVSLLVNDGMTRSPVDTMLAIASPAFSIALRAKPGEVQVVWANLVGTERYDIYRAPESNPTAFVKIAETTSVYSTYLDLPLENEKSYLYVVGAVSQGQWRYSTVASMRPTTSRLRPNYPPILYSTPIPSGIVGILYVYDVNATDPNGNVLRYSLVGSPAGMVIDVNTGRITWTPTATGNAAVRVSVTDGAGGTVTQDFSIAVGELPALNRPPIAEAGGPYSANIGQAVQFDGRQSSDPDNDALVFAWNFGDGSTGDGAMPLHAYVNPGVYEVTLSVDDGRNGTAVDHASVSVVQPNRPPALLPIAGQAVNEGQTLTFEVTASDPDNNLANVAIAGHNLPSAPTFTVTADPLTRLFSWTPGYDHAGAYGVSFVARDSQGLAASLDVPIVVNNVNRPPSIAPIAPQTVAEETPLTFTVQASDPDGDTLTFSYAAASLPSQAALTPSADPNAYVLAWTPSDGHAGTYVVPFAVTDTGNLFATIEVQITVTGGNHPPVIAPVPSQVVSEGESLTFQVTASDPDGDLVTLVLTQHNLPSLPTFTPASVPQTATFAWTPVFNQAGRYVVTFVATDSQSLTASIDVPITVVNVNRPPTLAAVPPQTVAENVSLSFTLRGSDPDGDPLTFRNDGGNLPSQGVLAPTVDPNVFSFQWTPTFAQAGTYSVRFSVTDPGNLSASIQVQITATNVNRPPTLAPIAHQSVRVGTALSLQLVAVDPDGGRLTYGSAQLPTGATLVAETGAFVWTPTEPQVGSRQVMFSVSDGESIVYQPATIEVTIENGAPRILTDGLPDAEAEKPYQVQIVAQDPDGDTITYRLVAAPATMAINNATGLIDWLPMGADVGTQAIVVTVDDGRGGSDTRSYVLVVKVTTPNRPPIITSTPVVEGYVNSIYLYAVTATDPDSDPLQYSLLSAPDGAAIDAATGLVQWTPSIGQLGAQPVTVEVNDGRGGLAAQPYTVVVLGDPTNNPPAIVSTPITTVVGGQPYAYDVDAIDPDGDVLSYSLTAAPAGMTIDAQSGLISWAASAPPCDVVVRASDGRGGVAEQAFAVNVISDLTIATVETHDLVYDGQSLAVSGTVTALIANIGNSDITAPLEVLFFEDTDYDSLFTESIDSLLGMTTVAGPILAGQRLTVVAELAGVMTFGGNFVWGFVDSGGAVQETNENNNIVSSANECVFVPPVGQFNPVVEWAKTEFGVAPTLDDVMMTPAVADLNGDGIPEIVFGSFAWGSGAGSALRAINGRDGNEVWTVAGSGYDVESGIAIGDIDDDGKPEIVAATYPAGLMAFGLVAFEHDGTFKWRTSAAIPPTGGCGPAIADLDHDGLPEIILGNCVFNNNGAFLWNGADFGGLGRGYPEQGRLGLSVVADLDLDGTPEIIAGRTAYRNDGTVYWNADVPDGYVAIGNFDDDDFPEIVLTAAGYLYVLEHTGQVKWSSVYRAPTGPPTIGDVDGDGLPEIGVLARSPYYVVFDTDGTVKWEAEINENSPVTGSSMFDFDGDGSTEVVYADQERLWIFRGSDGSVLYELLRSSPTVIEYPVVADVDADGNAEIVVTASDEPRFGVIAQRHGIYVIGDYNDTWVPTRKIWNQYSYCVTNVNDDASIPTHEQNSWLVHNTYRCNVWTEPVSPFAAPNLTASYVQYNVNGSDVGYRVRVGNAGVLFAPQGVSVALYDGDPKNGGAFVARALTSAQLEPGRFEDVTIHVPAGAVTDLYVWADDDGTGHGSVSECNEEDNIYHPVFVNDSVDLTMSEVDVGAVAYDAQTLQASGTVTGRVTNLGPNDLGVPFEVLFFEDRDHDGKYTARRDAVLASTAVSSPLAAGDSLTVSGTVSGRVEFPGASILGFVDSSNVVRETDEANNFSRGMVDCHYVREPGAFGAVLEWSKSTYVDGPTSNRVIMTPVVVDLNRDGVPEIVFASHDGRTGSLRVIDGKDGRELWSSNNGNLRVEARLAVGDIDADGYPEIVGVSFDASHLWAFEHNGQQKWTSAQLSMACYSGAPSIADIDHDGVPEIIIGATVLNNDGTIRWVGSAPGGGIGSLASADLVSTVADIDMDGTPEIVAGKTAYRSDGSLFWNAALPGDGYAAVANFDDDPFPEIAIVVANGGGAPLYLLKHTGEIIWGPVSVPGEAGYGYCGPLTIADVDGDGRPEIIVTRANRISVLGDDGRVKWQFITEEPYGLQAATAFDLDADGQCEIIHADTRSLRIFRGVDGQILFEQRLVGDPTFKSPIVVDVDGDGNAEIVVGADNLGSMPGIYVFGGPNGSWGTARSIWNEYSYHVTNVNDDGTIPRVEQNHWQTSNTFRCNVPVSVAPAPVANLVPCYVRYVITGLQVTYTVRIGNSGGLVAPAGVHVAVYDGDPLAGGVALGTSATTAVLEPGRFEDVRVTVPLTDLSNVWVSADDDGTGVGQVYECNENDNRLHPSGVGGGEIANQVPAFTSTPRLNAFVGEAYRYRATAQDPDGDTVSFDFPLGSPSGMFVDAVTGHVVWTPMAQSLGVHQVSLRVNDGRGGVALQTFEVTVSFRNSAPFITSVPPTTAVASVPLTYHVLAQDAEGQAIEFRLDAAPQGMSIASTTGLLSWTPNGSQLGVHAVSVVARDVLGAEGVQAFNLQVVGSGTNEPPFITSTPRTLVGSDQDYRYQVEAVDGNSDPLAFSLSTAPTGMVIGATGLVSWRPVIAQLGQHSVVVRVEDGRGGLAQQDFAVQVVAHVVNGVPVISSVPVFGAVPGRTYAYNAIGSDPDGDPIVWSLDAAPAGMSVDPQRGAIRWTPAVQQIGAHPVALTVHDSLGALATQSYTVIVHAVNVPPSITSVPPTEAFVGSLYTYQVLATDQEGDRLTFALVNPPTGMEINADTGAVRWTPAVEQVGAQTVIVAADDGRGGHAEQAYTLQVINGQPNQPPWITSIPPGVAAESTLYTYSVLASDPEGGQIVFSLGIAPPGMTIDGATGVVRWTPTQSQIGTHFVRVVVMDSAGLHAYQSYGLTVLSSNQTPVITSVPRTMALEDALYEYQVAAQDPDNDTLSYSFVASVAGMTIDAATGLIQWRPEAAHVGDRTIAVRVDDEHGAFAVQSYTLSVVEVNDAPVIVSTPVIRAASTVPYAYRVQAVDEEGDAFSFALDLTPNGMTINAGNGLIEWRPATSQIGVQAVTVRVTDVFGASSTQSYTVTVADNANAPVITEIPDQIRRDPEPFAAINLDAFVSDRDNADSELAWSFTGNSRISVAIDANRVAVVSYHPGTRAREAVTFTATDPGGLFGQTTVVFVVAAPSSDNTSPVAALSVYPNPVNVGQWTEIIVLAQDDGGLATVSVLADGAELSVYEAGDGTFWSMFFAGTAGVHAIETVVVDMAANEFRDRVDLYVFDPTLEAPLTASITAPVDDTVLKEPTAVIGTASGDNFVGYKLEYAATGTEDFVEFASGNAAVVDGVVGEFDPTVLGNGIYTIRLTAFNLGGQFATASAVVEADGGTKVGPFTVAFQDKTLLLGKSPLTVVRSYDNRNKIKGDFGIGWRLAMSAPTLVENCIPGNAWHQTSHGYWLRSYHLGEDRTHTVTINFSDREKFQFRPAPSPSSQNFEPISYLDGLGFTPIGETQGTLVADIQAFWFLDSQIYDPDFFVYNPTEYTYTASDGVAYKFRRSANSTLSFELFSITDREGVTISITPTGLVRSDGRSIGFMRDAEGRITSVEDPNGANIRYEYNVRGDLVAFIDEVGNRTTYTYDRNHNLIDIRDPLGNRAIRTEYDSEGRIVATTDAKGNRVEFTHNIAGHEEIVRDRRGNVTRYIYDDDGNVLSEVKSVTIEGVVVPVARSFTYDGRGNKLSETDPEGRTATWVYDGHDNVTSETDFEGRTTARTFSATNEILTATDPTGMVTSNTYDGAGRLTRTVMTASDNSLVSENENAYDANGNLIRQRTRVSETEWVETGSRYDGYGNQTTSIDPLGNRTVYTYDGSGNRSSEAFTRTLPDGSTEQVVTRYEYDAKGRLTRTVNALGAATVVAYTPFDKQASITDASARTTRFEYDATGNLTRTVMADGSADSSTYDEEGRKLSSTDREGHTTFFEYDELGRQVRAIAADDTPADLSDNPVTETVYDRGGRVVARIDALGNRTEYEYVVATATEPRREIVRDALGNETVREFDLSGKEIHFIDALGRVTNSEYDSAGRLTRKIFDDGSFTRTEYDFKGQKIAETDQAGVRTQFRYDILGRLVAVENAAGEVTSYSYDDTGSQITQTDAMGRTTRFEYDALKRRTARVLPLGQRETVEYSASGQLLSKTDFNGRTTRPEYDAMGRVSGEIAPDGSEIGFTYTPSGKRLQVTDSRGETRYEYNAQGQILRRTDPDGSSIAYTYDAAGNRTSVTTPAGTTSYAFDALNRLATVTDPAGAVTSYAYDGVGNRECVTYPNGNSTSHTYDRLNRLTNVSTRNAAGDLIASYTYTLGPTGNRLQVVEAGSATTGRTVRYAYDTLYRLTTETIDEPGTTNDVQISYAFDAVGNRLERLVVRENGTVTTAYAYDNNDRLLHEAETVTVADSGGSGGGSYVAASMVLGPSVGCYSGTIAFLVLAGLIPIGWIVYLLFRLKREDERLRWARLLSTVSSNSVLTFFLLAMLFSPCNLCAMADSAFLFVLGGPLMAQEAPGTTSYTYDNNGNTLTKTKGLTRDVYVYDYRNRLESAVVQSGDEPGNVSYAYDVENIRVGKTHNGEETSYLVDHNQPYAQVVLERKAGADISYVQGDDLISMTRPVDQGGTKYYHYDGHLSTRQLADSTGTVTDSYVYDAFGNLLSSTGTTVNEFRYTGEQYDANVGFYYLRARYYNTEIGRFQTQDGYEGSSFDPATLHLYLYVQNDPVNWVDPSGYFLTAMVMQSAVTFGVLLKCYIPTITKALTLLAGITLFMKPGFEFRNLAIEMIASGRLGSEGLAAALDIYLLGERLIELGANVIKWADTIANWYFLFNGVVGLAKALSSVPSLTVSLVDITRFEQLAISISVQGGKFVSILAKYKSVEVILAMSRTFKDWSNVIFELEKLFIRIGHTVEKWWVSR